MTEEEIKNKISEYKKCCKKLAEEYRQRYNEDNTDKLALNMFYHNVISYNDYESVLALIENRNSMIMCFSAPHILTEETVEINLKRITELEKENAALKDELQTWKKASENNSYKAFQFEKENKELKSWKCKAETYMNYLIGLAQGSGLEKDNLVLEAEQFLKDNEVKNALS